jgi:membrane protease YdiL (CAAX protease family)
VALVVLIAAVGAPLFEELFYRGLFLRAVQRRLGDAAAVAIPALVFGLVHFQPYDFVALVLFGVAMGVVALRTGRLGTAIWAHVAFNATALLTLLYL